MIVKINGKEISPETHFKKQVKVLVTALAIPVPFIILTLNSPSVTFQWLAIWMCCVSISMMLYSIGKSIVFAYHTYKTYNDEKKV